MLTDNFVCPIAEKALRSRIPGTDDSIETLAQDRVVGALGERRGEETRVETAIVGRRVTYALYNLNVSSQRRSDCNASNRRAARVTMLVASVEGFTFISWRRYAPFCAPT